MAHKHRWHVYQKEPTMQLHKLEQLGLVLENTIFLEIEELRAACGTLYVFRQYSYLQK